VLNKEDYLSKLKDRTKNHTPLQEDPAINHEKALAKALNDMKERPSRIKDKDSFILRRSELGKFITTGAPAPWNHGLMKLHKDGFPLRDISDASQSPGHSLAKSLNQLFVGYTGRSKHHLKSHSDLIGLIKTGLFNEGFFVSFDAVELYPSIVIEDALQLLEQKMNSDTDWTKKTDLSRSEVLHLVRILISAPYFECELGFLPTGKRNTHGRSFEQVTC
jgi:hypothetical protein